MSIRKILLSACAAATLITGAAIAAPSWVPPGNDPGGYNSNQDVNGYYDRDGHFQRVRFARRDRDYGPPPPDRGYGPPPPRYESGPPAYAPARDCRRDNRTTGTILGAITGGLIGGFASHGNGLATVGGVIGGGVLGNVIAGDMDCEDQGQAYPIYVDSLNGDIGRPYEWRRGPNRGTFTSTREYRRGGQICREFTATTWRGGNSHTRTGVACRESGDRGWRFD
jgi:surface antigen